MKIIEFFFGDDWLEYKVLFKYRTIKYISYENGKLSVIGGERMKSTIMYCHKIKTGKYNKSFGEYWYDGFYNNPKNTQRHDETLPIYKVRVRELRNDEKSIYWGWWKNKENRFIFIAPTRSILSMYFGYPMKLLVESGDGKDYNVKIEELEIFTLKK